MITDKKVVERKVFNGIGRATAMAGEGLHLYVLNDNGHDLWPTPWGCISEELKPKERATFEKNAQGPSFRYKITVETEQLEE